VSRPPLPTALKALRGNPGQRPLNDAEPLPPDADLDPPENLTDTGREKWVELAVLLARMKVFTQADRTTLERYCLLHEQWLIVVAHVREHGMTQLTSTGYSQITAEGTLFKSLPGELLKIEREFGMTPAARSSLRLPSAPAPEDPLEAYLQGRSG